MLGDDAECSCLARWFWARPQIEHARRGAPFDMVSRCRSSRWAEKWEGRCIREICWNRPLWSGAISPLIEKQEDLCCCWNLFTPTDLMSLFRKHLAGRLLCFESHFEQEAANAAADLSFLLDRSSLAHSEFSPNTISKAHKRHSWNVLISFRFVQIGGHAIK